MAKKKNTQLPVSQEENEQAQDTLAQYHQIATNLRVSTDQEAASAALSAINSQAEGAQIALVKALSKENHVDAADVLIAIHELSPSKSTRKEAKRSLIRLAGERIYPGWQPPLNPVLPITAIQSMTNPPRFFKGIVTDSMDTGEAQLILCWEQGDNYSEVRVLGFLLEFWHDGIKDAFTHVESKRSFEKFLAHMAASLDDVETKNCSLAQGRHLLQDALAINKKYGTTPHRDYRLNLSLINQLILNVPDLDDEEYDDLFDEDEDEEDEETIDLHDLKPANVVSLFVENHISGNFGTAYDLLAQDSPLREGLTKEEWIERRKPWEQEANPGVVEPNFIFEHEQPRSRIWLPNRRNAGRNAATTEIETGWSAELDETPLGDTLPELPKATTVYEETRRHWFWVTYTIVQENGEWRMQSMSDEGVKAQNLSIKELQEKIQENDDYLETSAKKRMSQGIKQLKEEEIMSYLAEISRRVMQSLYYSDVLLKKLPSDETLYIEAADRAITFIQYERSLVYFLPLIQRFPDLHAPRLRQVAVVEREISSKYADEGDDERAEHFQELAEQALRESLAIEDSFEAHITLAELFIDKEEQLDEAKDHLLQAKKMITNDPGEDAHIALHLGEIAAAQEEYEEALVHFQRVVDLRPEEARGWYNLGLVHQDLHNVEEAIASYQHAIELSPDSEDYYYLLSRLYSDNNQYEKAVESLKNGLVANPDSAALHAFLVSLYIEHNDYRQAEFYLKRLERMDTESEFVHMLRPVLELSKAGQTLPEHQPRKFLKKKRENR